MIESVPLSLESGRVKGWKKRSVDFPQENREKRAITQPGLSSHLKPQLAISMSKPDFLCLGLEINSLLFSYIEYSVEGELIPHRFQVLSAHNRLLNTLLANPPEPRSQVEG
jgi:hypothetical protein